jgi:toxin YoeB
LEHHRKSGNKKQKETVYTLFTEIVEHPRTGTGQAEQLKYFEDREIWSRRIDAKHRLIYEIKETELIVLAISAYGHYEAK